MWHAFQGRHTSRIWTSIVVWRLQWASNPTDALRLLESITEIWWCTFNSFLCKMIYQPCERVGLFNELASSMQYWKYKASERWRALIPCWTGGVLDHMMPPDAACLTLLLRNKVEGLLTSQLCVGQACQAPKLQELSSEIATSLYRPHIESRPAFTALGVARFRRRANTPPVLVTTSHPGPRSVPGLLSVEGEAFTNLEGKAMNSKGHNTKANVLGL